MSSSSSRRLPEAVVESPVLVLGRLSWNRDPGVQVLELAVLCCCSLSSEVVLDSALLASGVVIACSAGSIHGVSLKPPLLATATRSGSGIESCWGEEHIQEWPWKSAILASGVGVPHGDGVQQGDGEA